MLTVKLVRGEAVRIVEAARVDVSRVPDVGREVSVTNGAGAQEDFLVAGPEVEGAYDIAYVENAHGQTTQVVRPR